MSKLADSTCEACRIDAPMVADDDALILLKEIEDWHIIDNGFKQIKLKAFIKMILFVLQRPIN